MLFSKSENLYGIEQARQAAMKAGYVAIVEGYTDVLMAHQFGILEVVATMGTALNHRHVAQLRRFVPRVVLVFDADAGGDTGVDRALQVFVRYEMELQVATLIEYSHRAVTGVEGILVALFGISAWIAWRGRGARALVLLMASTLVLQAGLGAWAVLSPQSPFVLATHFGISLLCFAGTALLAGLVLRDADAPESPAVAPGYRRAVWGVMLFTLLVVMTPAFWRK